jgi:hypothetical protein
MIEIPSAGNMWRKALLVNSSKEQKEFENLFRAIEMLAGEGKAYAYCSLLSQYYRDLLTAKGYQVIEFKDHLEVAWSPT